ncbi:unnamed protein product [Vicia faba]|uniref:Uncharacterized protein n=1 Tax=Vicia faba TaxID=3906 RepID=A0AAV0ZBR4_VICFA|nr:unnamed protein product [Vicia faba]
MQETKSQFQAQEENIKILETQIGQITTTLRSWAYEEPKSIDIRRSLSVTSPVAVETTSDVPESRASRIFVQEIPPPLFPQRIRKTKEDQLFEKFMFMKEEELKEEGDLRRPPPKPTGAIWLEKYEALEMTSDMTPTQKIPFLSLLKISVYCVLKNENGKAFVSSLKVNKKKLKSKDDVV